MEAFMSNNNLEYFETVQGGNNGYPRGFKNVIMGFESWEQLEVFIDSAHTIWSYLEDEDDRKLIVTYRGMYYDYIDKNPISYSYDTHNYAFGVLHE